MSASEIEKKLEPVFRKVFNEPDMKITQQTGMEDIGQWESLTHLQLINEIESVFQLSFELDEVIEIKTVGDIIRILYCKLGNE